jgi:Signal transduction histidine kinase
LDIKLINNFKELKLRIFLRVIITPILAFLIGWIILRIFIDGMLQDPFARGFVYISRRLFGLYEEDAISLYALIFRNNKSLWILLGYSFIMILIFYRSLSPLIRYFNEVNNALDHLLEDADDEVTLSPAIETIEKKLNKIKSTLKIRRLDAQNAEQRKNDLVVYLAHDIKTPLTSVIGYLSLLEEAPDMPPQQKAKYVKITLEKAFRLEQLINEFFEITRYNLQTILLEKQEIDLSYMLAQMADEFYPQLAASGKSALVNASEHIMLYGDPDKLARVFNNIMKNAIAYGYENSEIEIRMVAQEDTVLITFSNCGNTIPKHKLETIFDKFYRLDDARSSGTGGSGLGLAIAKSIVTSHGGSIYAESENEHTVFSVTLPVHTA